MSQPLPPKKEVALALLERSRVHVHLDPRKEGVTVPMGFRKQPQLVLEIGLNMPVPIPDLRLDDAGMSCTLSFSRTPFYCVVPWPSVFAMVGDDGRGMVWPDDVPGEIAAQAQAPVRAAEQPPPRPRPAAAKRIPDARRPDAAGSEAGGSEASGAEAGAGASDEKPKKRASRSKKPRIAVVENPPPERPVLVALPPPPEPRGPRAVPSEKKRAPQPRRPGAAGSAGKGKRELPPYLRVVK